MVIAIAIIVMLVMVVMAIMAIMIALVVVERNLIVLAFHQVNIK